MLELLPMVDEAPEANDVVAGWTGLLIVLALVAAVAVLGWSLTKQLKKADQAKAEGRYDDPKDPGDPDHADHAGDAEGQEGSDGASR